MFRIVLLSLLVLSLMMSSAFAFPQGSGFRFLYSSDSDNVNTHSYSYDSSAEDQEMPFSYTLTSTRIEQTGGYVNEVSLVGRWRKEFEGDQALTLWTGMAKNNQYNFFPYSAMYDKTLSPKEHVWLSFEHTTVGTVEAYKAGIHRDSYTFSYRDRLNSKLDWSTTLTRGLLNDGNQEDIASVALTQSFNRNLKLGLDYNYDNAKFTNPGFYFVPQGLKVISLKPEIAFDIGRGSLQIYTQQPLWVRNNTGHISYYVYGSDFKMGGFSLGYMYTKDDKYTSRVYKAGYAVEW